MLSLFNHRISSLNPLKCFLRAKSTNGINVSNYETGFNASKPKDSSLVDELDLLSLSFEPGNGNNGKDASDSSAVSGSGDDRSGVNPRRGNRSAVGKYPTGNTPKQRCYNCGQIGHISFDCQQPQVRKACYTCGNSGHLARDCPQSHRPIICYVCRQPGHLASKCPSNSNGQSRSSQDHQE